jgi:hypothetical protein
MISVLSTTGKYLLQPSLMEMHHSSLEWLSTTVSMETGGCVLSEIVGSACP